ncbi:MAG TPA: four helix bundle protein [Saprospiraceae bacterium]|nr:four helix bundle protein [Saprospiraceae bacterium]
MKAKFRFQDLKIWREAIELGLIFFEISNRIETQKLFRFADQLRGVAMSISNNIAESTGTDI